MYDAGGTLIQIDEVGGAKTDYISASGMTLARIAGSTVTWLHHEHLGSAVPLRGFHRLHSIRRIE